jgi:periplasmic divalent cation tolerance protein
LTRHLAVLSTIGSAEDAERIARALVEQSLAACVNVVPGVVSTYRWKGEVQRDAELLLVIKTRADRFAALEHALRALHPYEVPEAIALPIVAGHGPYLAWLDAAVGPVRPAAAGPARSSARPAAARRLPGPGRGRRSGPARPRSRR